MRPGRWGMWSDWVSLHLLQVLWGGAVLPHWKSFKFLKTGFCLKETLILLLCSFPLINQQLWGGMKWCPNVVSIIVESLSCCHFGAISCDCPNVVSVKEENLHRCKTVELVTLSLWIQSGITVSGQYTLYLVMVWQTNRKLYFKVFRKMQFFRFL